MDTNRIDVAHWTEQTEGLGKFQGEGPETAYFYASSCDGDGELLDLNEHESSGSELFETTAEEREAFGADPEHTYFLLVWNSHGFVSGEWLTSEGAAAERARVEREREEAQEERERELALSDRQPRYALVHSSATGCHPITVGPHGNATYRDTMADALADLRERVEYLRARGFEVDYEDLPASTRAEVLEPEGCGMVPDEGRHTVNLERRRGNASARTSAEGIASSMSRYTDSVEHKPDRSEDDEQEGA